MRNDVVIIGGGPAGLLLASQLQQHGIRYRLLERGKAAQSWRNMRHGMMLLSPSVQGTDWTSLTFDRPLWSIPGTKRPFPSREDFLCYIESFVRENRIAVEDETFAMRARRTPGGFSVDTTRGTVDGRFLVIATGGAAEPAYPDVPGLAGNPAVIHSGDFVDCMAYAGKRMLVVGGGNSGAELAIALAGTAASVTLCTRNPLSYFSESGQLDDIRGSSESLLKELIKFRIIDVREADPPAALDGGKVRFRSGGEERYDCVLCATGYKPGWLPVDGDGVRADAEGYPVISATGESTVPGLYFIGSLARFHRRCAFIHGFRNYVEKVLWDIADRL
jgi:putative flavoprotein involved in K+ transport